MMQAECLTDTREGKPQIISNIEAWKMVSDYLSSTLGPYGMDKMFINGDKLLITNDGATILKRKNFDHPATRILVSISENQDKIIGDGTTSVVLLASEFLQKLKQLIKDDFSMEAISETLEELKDFCLEKLETLKVDFHEEYLYKVAETAVNSKVLKFHKKQFSKIVVNSLKGLDDLDSDLLGIKKVAGGSIGDSFLVEGIAFEKCFTYAGYEQQPKKILSPKILCLNIELEWKSEKDNSEIRINSVDEYQKIVDAEWKIIKDKLDQIIESGATVVLSKLPIGDFATQYFARNNIFCSGRVDDKDLKRVAMFSNTTITSTTSILKVGECEEFEEKQIGKNRFNFLKGSLKKATTIILRGPGETTLEEMERSVHDSLMVVKNVLKNKEVVYGGGAIEMQLSCLVREKSYQYDNKKLFVATCIAQAFEVIPFTLASNFGLDAIAVLQLLRKKHQKRQFNYGVDNNNLIGDMNENNVYEPVEVKRNILRAAFSAAKAVIGIDMTIISRKRE